LKVLARRNRAKLFQRPAEASSVRGAMPLNTRLASKSTETYSPRHPTTRMT